jgi:hypothetical protein
VNLRHAAAVALLAGWYLLLPPRPSPKSFRAFDANAPFLDWDIIGEFKTLSSCQKKLRVVRNAAALSPSDAERMRKRGLKPLAGTEREEENDYLSHAACVATDDPGLKEK